MALPIFNRESIFSGDLKGNLLISFAVVAWSLYVVMSKSLQKKFSPVVITSIFIFLSTIVFFFLGLTEISNHNGWWNNMKTTSFFAVAYIALIGTVGGYLLNQYAIKLGGPVLASLSFYFAPIFGYFFSFLLLSERLTAGLITGTVLIFISVALTTYSK